MTMGRGDIINAPGAIGGKRGVYALYCVAPHGPAREECTMTDVVLAAKGRGSNTAKVVREGQGSEWRIGGETDGEGEKHRRKMGAGVASAAMWRRQRAFSACLSEAR